MLSMGRNPGQYVVIGDNIVIQVFSTPDGLLRLAIDAPKDVSIVRGENYELDNQVPDCIQQNRKTEGKVLSNSRRRVIKGQFI